MERLEHLKDLSFVNLLHAAKEIQIQELTQAENPEMLRQLGTTLREGESQVRRFLISLKGAEPVQVPTAQATALADYSSAQLLQSAQVLLENEEFLLSRNIYSLILEQDLKNPEALLGLGICFLRLGQAPSARRCFKALQDLYKHPKAMPYLAESHLLEKDDAKAVQVFSKIENWESVPVLLREESLRLWGNALSRLGKITEAIEKYELALRLNPNSDKLLGNIATLQLQQGNLKESEVYYLRALALDTRNSRAWCGLGILETLRANSVRAEENFDQALSVDPLNKTAIEQLLLISELRKNFDKVKMYLRTYLLKKPKDVDLRYALALVHFRESRWADCRRDLEAILAEFPDCGRAKALLGTLQQIKPV